VQQRRIAPTTSFRVGDTRPRISAGSWCASSTPTRHKSGLTPARVLYHVPLRSTNSWGGMGFKQTCNHLCLGCIIAADVCFSVALRFLGPVLVILANCLIGLVVYIYLTLLAPRYLVPLLGNVLSGMVVCFGLWLLFNILFNYWSCVLTSPGAPASQLPPLEDLEAGTDFSDYGDGWRQCRKCKSGKPPRTHHCSVCRRCVMKMDHHCPWVNNCVGFYNYKFFCLFLLYTAAGCLYTALTCFLAILSPQHHDHMIVFIFILTLSVLFALTVRALTHSRFPREGASPDRVGTHSPHARFFSPSLPPSDF
jgi:hypothetical protein